MMLWKVVCKVAGAFAPMEDVLPLFGTIIDSVEVHVNGFSLVLFDGVINNVDRAGVRGLDVLHNLEMSHLSKGNAERGYIFDVVEEGTGISYGGRGEHINHD
jgi:hypothetical protein